LSTSLSGILLGICPTLVVTGTAQTTQRADLQVLQAL
jgi:hypothetical protein